MLNSIKKIFSKNTHKKDKNSEQAFEEILTDEQRAEREDLRKEKLALVDTDAINAQRNAEKIPANNKDIKNQIAPKRDNYNYSGSNIHLLCSPPLDLHHHSIDFDGSLIKKAYSRANTVHLKKNRSVFETDSFFDKKKPSVFDTDSFFKKNKPSVFDTDPFFKKNKF